MAILCFSKLIARLGGIEIQSRSSLDRGHFMARYRCRRHTFLVSREKKIHFLILTILCVCRRDSRLCRCRNRRHKFYVSGTTLAKCFTPAESLAMTPRSRWCRWRRRWSWRGRTWGRWSRRAWGPGRARSCSRRPRQRSDRISQSQRSQNVIKCPLISLIR